jgi:hypothetical protein
LQRYLFRYQAATERTFPPSARGRTRSLAPCRKPDLRLSAAKRTSSAPARGELRRCGSSYQRTPRSASWRMRPSFMSKGVGSALMLHCSGCMCAAGGYGGGVKAIGRSTWAGWARNATRGILCMSGVLVRGLNDGDNDEGWFPGLPGDAGVLGGVRSMIRAAGVIVGKSRHRWIRQSGGRMPCPSDQNTRGEA